jgi:hypothetical protein
MRQQFADAVLGAFEGMSPQDIRASGRMGEYMSALGIKQSGLGQEVEDAKRKAELGTREDARLQSQLEKDDRFRRDRLAEADSLGLDDEGKKRIIADIGRESDALLLSRTEGINPKDLTLDQFSARQDALRRRAEQEEIDRQDAKAATAKAEIHRQKMVDELVGLREGILNGDMKVLIQIQNDTQARIDQEALQNANDGPNGARVRLDQGKVKSNPLTPSREKYFSGGQGRFGY